MIYEIMDIMELQDVETFLEQIAHEIQDFHPLVDFKDYVYPDSYMRRYTDEEASIRNYLLEKCFDVCARHTSDFFTYLLQLYRRICAEMNHEAKRRIIRAAANTSSFSAIQLPLFLPHSFR